MRRHCSTGGRACASAAIGSSVQRPMTTRGQHNPMHHFEYGLDKGMEAKDAVEFRRMVTNPGPMRFEFSPDYMDWYYRAYLTKKSHRALKQRVSDQAMSPSSPAVATSVGVPPGMAFRPAASQRRRVAEATRAKAQQTIADCAVAHGMHDALERLPQVPAIHIDKATDDHVRMIFDEYILKEAVSPLEVWEKALLFRAMLLAKQASYPDAFKYILTAANDVVLDQKTVSENGVELLANPDKFPSLEQYQYYEHLVKKYSIDNAVEAHVVLRCHRLANAPQVLVSQPPPLEDPSPCPALPNPADFPPLKALMEVEENAHLLRCLIFAEFNTIVTTDPFLKFVAAKEHVSRGDHQEAREKSGTAAEAGQAISGRRGTLLPALSRSTMMVFDGRAKEVLRIGQDGAAQGAADVARELPRLAEENPAHFQTDLASFNPRTVRPEIRDATSMAMLRALRDYERAADGIFRVSYETIAINNSQAMHRNNQLPPYQPTMAHHLRQTRSDKHVSFVRSCLASADPARAAVEAASYELAKHLLQASLEFHKQQNRQLHMHKVRIAGALLDEAIAAAQQKILETDGPAAIWRGLGQPVPFATRPFDEFGFPSSARFDDYTRWMQTPAAA